MRRWVLLAGPLLLGLPPALGLGIDRPQTLSALGQPLDLSFPVRLSESESLDPDCMHAEVTAGETKLPAHRVQLRIEGGSDQRPRVLRVLTSAQIDEPVVMVTLSLGCPARFVRQYTAFVDPPGLAQLMQPSVAAMPPEPASRGYSPALRAALATSQARPGQLIAAPERGPELPQASAVGAASSPAAARPAAADAVPAAAPRLDKPKPSASKPVEPAKRAKPPKPAKPAKPVKPAKADDGAATAKPAQRGASDGSRLSLEPAPLALAAASQPASAEQAAALPAAAASRLAGLEQGLAQMQQRQSDAQAQIAALRLQLERERADRRPGALLYGMGLLSLLLGLLSLYLWRSRQRELAPHESQWWSEAREIQAHGRKIGGATHAAAQPWDLAPDAEPAAAATPEPAPELRGATSWAPAAASSHVATLPMDLPTDEPPRTAAAAGAIASFGADAEAAGAAAVSTAAEPISIQLLDSATERAPVASEPVTVESLIDLEQQVQFFVLLGQDDAAIELLEQRLQGGMRALSWPYLRLLEIHQRRGDTPAFEALAVRMRQATGVPAPDHAVPLGQGDGLLGRPSLLAEVQQGWRDSGASMALLQRALAGPLQEGSEPLDLASYHDLLLLYGVARDLSEHEVRGEQIDLFLPLDASTRASADMMATMPWQSAPGQVFTPRTLAVDISLDEGGEAGAADAGSAPAPGG